MDRIRAVFGNQVLAILLFGSVARGEDRADSDANLLIVLGAEERISPALYRHWDSEIGEPRFADRLVSPHFAHRPADFDQAGSLWLEVAIEGRCLYDPQGLAGQWLRELRSRIAAGRYTRKLSQGHPYWVRNDINKEN